MTARAFDGVVFEREEKGCSPSIEGCEEASLFFTDKRDEFRRELMFFSVNTIVPNHFEMLFGNMNDEFFDEIPSRNGFGNKFIIFVSVVMKSNKIAIVIINTRRSDHRSAKISPNVLKDGFVVG